MGKGQKEILTTRIISTSFVVLALGVFKPFGLAAWQWQAYLHLSALLGLGFVTCLVTEAILKYLLRKPISEERGVGYIINRNLLFQLVNTPLVAIVVCLYRHFVLSDRVPSNRLSWVNFLETLAIIAFCSFAIGLYWRFKYRSRYLAAELKETQRLNERLQLLQSDSTAKEDTSRHDTITLTGTTSETVTLVLDDLLYVEAVGNYVKINHLSEGSVRSDMLRATTKQIEQELLPFTAVIRCHRAFLVNLRQVEQIMTKAGSMQLLIKHIGHTIPVSRSNVPQVKKAL